MHITMDTPSDVPMDIREHGNGYFHVYIHGYSCDIPIDFFMYVPMDISTDITLDIVPYIPMDISMPTVLF